MFIQTEETPNPATLKFLPGQTVLGAGTANFSEGDNIESSPIAKKLFDVEGVVGVFLGSDFISITKKEDFYKIKGFEPVKNQLSGDDMYIVQAISNLKGAIFNYNPNSFVTTSPKNTIIGYLNQRIRWSSNSKFTLKSSPLFFAFLLSAFLANSSILYFIITLSNLSLLLILTKFFLEGFVIFSGSRIFFTKVSFLSYLAWNLVQPIYVPFIGIAGLIGKFSLKE